MVRLHTIPLTVYSNISFSCGFFIHSLYERSENCAPRIVLHNSYLRLVCNLAIWNQTLGHLTCDWTKWRSVEALHSAMNLVHGPNNVAVREDDVAMRRTARRTTAEDDTDFKHRQPSSDVVRSLSARWSVLSKLFISSRIFTKYQWTADVTCYDQCHIIPESTCD